MRYHKTYGNPLPSVAIIGMPLSGIRIERGWMPIWPGSVISIRTDLPSSTERILAQ